VIVSGRDLFNFADVEVGPGDDVLHGGSGNDTLYGAAGRDGLHGDAGKDFADGGPARDVCAAERKVDCPTGARIRSGR
jgi:Ca2+-binding RTX toxin-like protein